MDADELDDIETRMEHRRLKEQWPALMEWDIASLLETARGEREELRIANERGDAWREMVKVDASTIESLQSELAGERVRASQLADALEKLSTYAASLAKGYTLDFAARVLESVEKSRSLLAAGVASHSEVGRDPMATEGAMPSRHPRYEAMPDDDGDFALVTFDASGKPSCVKHGAMNKLSESPPEGTGTWRCITTNSGGYRGQTGGCRAGCRESFSSRAAKEDV